MIEEISYGGWKNNLRLRGAKTELVITLDVGPRVIRYAHHDGPNVFVELKDQLGGTGEKEWKIRGGHRFWTAPEADHSYDPDNVPVAWKKVGESAVELTQAPSKAFGFQKILRIELLPGTEEMVRLTHRLVAVGESPLEITPWTLSVMDVGGTCVVPQPQADLHPSEFPEGRDTLPEEFLPDREFVLWPFTNLTDGRYRFSENFLRLSYRANLPATKLGLKFATGWIAYENKGVIFAKHLARTEGLAYPDRGVTLELFTNHAILEMESLAPLGPIAPGQSREHVEHWVLRPAGVGLADEMAAVDFFAGLPAVAS
jgi:hypothetical protein